MTVDELKILLDISDPGDVLKSNAKECSNGWLFVDSNDGHCYLFDRNGKEKDIHNLTKIDDDLFSKDCELTKIVVSSSVTSIGKFAFWNCDNLTSVTMPDSVTSIGRRAFCNCSKLMRITIPNGVPRIGNYMFYGCSRLMSVAIPDSVTSIEDYAFSYCSGLTGVTIPDSVTSIGEYAFFDCSKLTGLVFKGKTLEEVKTMKNYPFGIDDESIIKREDYS